MKNIKNIIDIQDIKLLVDQFYGKVREDKLLGPIFSDIIQDNWPEHLDKMYRFWQTILLEEHTYYGSPFAPHAKMPIESEHFEKWLKLFNTTIDEYFDGEKAKEAKWRAAKMAQMFQLKLEYFRANPSEKPIK